MVYGTQIPRAPLAALRIAGIEEVLEYHWRSKHFLDVQAALPEKLDRDGIWGFPDLESEGGERWVWSGSVLADVCLMLVGVDWCDIVGLTGLGSVRPSSLRLGGTGMYESIYFHFTKKNGFTPKGSKT